MSRITRCTASVHHALALPRAFASLLSVLLASPLLPAIPSPAAAITTGFIENKGQTDPRVLYYARGANGTIYLTREGAVTDLRAPVEGTERAARIEARGEMETKYHFFLGDDPSLWRANVRAYREIVYRDVRPGVDLVFREDQGRVTCDAAAAPSAAPGASLVDDPGFLSWSTFLGGSSLENGVGVALDSSGNALVLGETYSVDLPATPGAYDVTFNGWVDMFVAKVSADGSTLLWCTFLGSSNSGVAEVPAALALDASGSVILTGYSSTGYPVTGGAYDTTWNGGDDIVVTKLSADGSSLVWSTYLGGSDYDFPSALAIDGSGNPVVTGGTYSTNFPTTAGAYDPTYSPSGNVFVSKLSADGSSLLWSTFVGGGEGGAGTSVVLDGSGNPIVTGYASSGEFPVTAGAYDTTWNGGDDAFVSKLSADGSSLLWSTFLGGAGKDEGIVLAAGPSGRVVVAGRTASADFPATPGAFQTSWKGGDDVFAAALSSDGSSLLWSTFLGGSDNDWVWDLAVDSQGMVVLGGTVYATGSSDFPVTHRTFDGSFNGGGLDGFVARLSSDGRFLTWSTFLGGSGADEGRGLVLNAFDDPVIVGTTDSADFPTTAGAYTRSLNGDATDVFVLRLDLDDPTGIGDAAPRPFASLLSCAPNPFAQATRIRYSLDTDTDVDLRVFDVLGRAVRVLDSGRRPAGVHEVAWDGRAADGRPAPVGVYFVRLVAGGRSIERKIVLVR